jgi:YD repeat-containing protein
MDVAADLAREASCAFGNRVSLTTGNTSTAWAANFFSIPALTSNPGTTATTSLSYDDNGNVTEVGTTTFYTYDFDNRLTQSSIWNGTGTTTTTYAYDPFGNRISQTASTTTTLYPSKYYSLTTTTTGTSTVATSSEDPVFLDSQQNLQDPQSLNAYSYSENNPIVREDPLGKFAEFDFSATDFGFSRRRRGNRVHAGAPQSTAATAVPVGGGGGSLPATVTQGGTTYYRNSSGLLSTAPSH